MNHSQLALPVALGPWVSGISVATVGGHGDERTVFEEPDHATTLTVRTIPGQGSELVVMGPRTRAMYHLGEPGPSCVRLRLRPGLAQPLLGRSVRALVDRAVPLGDLEGESDERLAGVLAELVAEPDGAGAELFLQRLGEALLAGLVSRQLGGRAPHGLVGAAARLLSVGTGSRPEQVGMVARRLHVSERQLRNLFAAGVGLSPKQFASIDRVRAVLASAPDRSWAQRAAEAGYYDQSHMTAEFRRLMGVPPGAFMAGALPAASSCDGS